MTYQNKAAVAAYLAMCINVQRAQLSQKRQYF